MGRWSDVGGEVGFYGGHWIDAHPPTCRVVGCAGRAPRDDGLCLDHGRHQDAVRAGALQSLKRYERLDAVDVRRAKAQAMAAVGAGIGVIASELGVCRRTVQRSYPSVFALGHKAIESLLTGPVVVQEKVDGSQFSFAMTEDGLVMRSKGATVYPENAQMFDKAVAAAQAVADKLITGWVYRAEYLMKPKHNTLLYGRVPANHLALYDVEIGLADFAPTWQVADEAARLGFDVVPTFYEGEVTDLDSLKAYLGRESFLGGGLVEGIVIKNYAQFTADKKVAMGKLVSEDFKERHTKEWKKSNPTSGDIVDQLIVEYRTEARWRKAIQHMAERGELQNAPQDIGSLLKEVGIDVRKEETEAISAALFKAFWPRIQRGITAGLPEWYKAQLAEQAFTEKAS